jgi:hypothetical protein
MTNSVYQLLEDIGRIQLSENFFFREFLYSEVAISHEIINNPENLNMAVEAGESLCQKILEPIQENFGRIHIRSGYRSSAVNDIGNINKLNCASNKLNCGAHIWDRPDNEGYIGATACIVIPKLLPYLNKTGDWPALAWWLHEHLEDYADICFFQNNFAFNIRWSSNPSIKKRIRTYVKNPDTGCKKNLYNNGLVHPAYTDKSIEQRYKKLFSKS